MDIKKQSKNNLWKYLLGVGAGLGVGYLAYKAFFSKGRNNYLGMKQSKGLQF